MMTNMLAGNLFGADVHPDVTPADPMELARLWVGDRVAQEPPLATLATVDTDGSPDARHVLLSAVDRCSFVFHTDVRSRKAAQLTARPRAALAVVWRPELRQLVVQGSVAPTQPDERAEAFARQSPYLQLLAWYNEDALASLPAEERRRRWAQLAEEHPPGTLEPPPWWRGYAITPHRLAFWRGDDAGPSSRLVYVRSDGGWQVTRQAG